ncbi:MAG: hypothetical protein K2Q18_15940 [Bdellovibrionales bacterium]|nr:hypothetical protein [Bdellovibrionales bacterium]
MKITKFKIHSATFALSLLLSNISLAASSIWPSEFMVQEKKAVFVDIKTINSKWVYEADNNFLKTESCLDVALEVEGHPVLLLKSSDQVTIDGKSIKIFHPVKTNDNFDTPVNLFILDQLTSTGTHKICVNSEISPKLDRTTFMNINYNSGLFTEGFLPANMRFDSFNGSVEIDVVSAKPYSVFTNGTVKRKTQNSFFVELLKNSTSSALFIDLVPTQKVIEKTFPVVLKNGRTLQVQLYSEKGDIGESFLLSFEQKIKRAFPIIESRLGDFPYTNYVFKAISRNVEGAFAGAAALQERYNTIDLVVHEIGHSYFLANVKPLRGVDVWLHEGLGRWASKYETGTEEFVPNAPKINLTTSWLLQQQIYDAHATGFVILKALDFKLKDVGGISPFLQKIFLKYQNKALSTEEFFVELENLTGQSFTKFKQHYFEGLK